MTDPKEILSKLEEHIKSDPGFKEEEVQVLRDIIDAYKAWATLGRATKWLLLLLASISAFIASWNHVTEALKKWLAS